MMRKANVTPIDECGNKLSPIAINLDGIDSLKFSYRNGNVYLNADGLRKEVMIAETQKEIHKMYQQKPREYKVRSTTQIVIEGNNDSKEHKNEL